MANKYTGEKCIVCGKPFEENDEIVVCPDCGTPYHKECWPEDDICVNAELHENGGSWESSQENAAPNTLRCSRCGTENAPGQKFCGECGMPLDAARFGERPFNNVPDGFAQYMNMNGADGLDGENGGVMPQPRPIRLTAQSDLDGIKLGDFFDYIGNRSITLITNFVKFAKTGGKLSFNIGAFFFPNFYFFYRRMTKQGILFLLLSFLLDIPTLILYGQLGTLGQVLFTTDLNVKSEGFQGILQICSLGNLSVQIIAAAFANYWYYRKARKDISAIRAGFGEKEPDIKTKEKIRCAGGTSWASVIGAFASWVILSLGFLLVMSYFF
ncbi:MAG: DUF2628 domain-containing protein [Ruminococcus sp.]|nr:DUF2628 domain-containing protein [Ruminococcus sp.]